MATRTSGHTATSETMEIRWDPDSRVALIRYVAGTNLAADDGTLMVDALTRWIGHGDEPFAVLADGMGLRGTDAAYRAKASGFFRLHRGTAYIALTNLSALIHVVVEMFRIGTGIQLKTFADEAGARSWLRARGIAA